MTSPANKSLMRNLGEFFGHLYKAVKPDSAKKRVGVSKTVDEETRGTTTLRRTTIEAIEIKRDDDPSS